MMSIDRKIGWPMVLIAVFASAVGCSDEVGFTTERRLCVEPREIDFGSVLIRSAEARILTLSNCGDSPLAELKVELIPDLENSTADDLPAFTVTSTELPANFAPGAFVNIPLRFRPTEVRPYQITALVSRLDSANIDAPFEITLTGQGREPGRCAVLSPESLSFPATEVGSSAELDLTVTNEGDAPCGLGGARVVAGDGNFIVASVPPTTLEPGLSAPITIRYQPRTDGAHTGTFALVIDGVNEVTAALDGEGFIVDRCALRGTPTPLVFARAIFGVTTTSAVATIESYGAIDCTIATVEALPAGFVVVAAPSQGTVVPIGGSTEVSLDFVPEDIGATSGFLRVTTVEGTIFELPLSAFADPKPACALEFSPAPVNFGAIAVGLGNELEVTITNRSTLSCDLTDIRLTPGSLADYTLLGALPTGPIAGGAAVTLDIAFAPTSASLSLGVLEVELDGTDILGDDLVGFGDYADFVMTPSQHHFGPITEGCVSDILEVQISNIGRVPGRLDSLGFSAASDPNFTVLSGITPGAMLADGQSVTAQVRMAGATEFGGQYAELRLASTGGVDPLVVSRLYATSESTADANEVEVFIQTERPTVDILFVIDNSGSMSEEQQSLAANFNAFIDFFTSQIDVDYHLGITTTDTDSNGEKGALVGPFIRNRGPSPTPDPVATFIAQAAVGTSGSGTEKGLLASVQAVTPPNTDPGGANQDFLRDEALLSIVYVTDEEDSSSGPVSDYVFQLLNAKGNNSEAIIVSAIAGTVPGGCSGTGGSAAAGARYLDMTLAFDGVFGPICAADWALVMEDIGFNTFAALTHFQLERAANVSTIVVLVNGSPVPQDPANGWTYDPITNAIVFHGTAVPAPGAEITVQYTGECLLP